MLFRVNAYQYAILAIIWHIQFHSTDECHMLFRVYAYQYGILVIIRYHITS